MITPSVMQGLTNENTMLSSVSIEDLEEYKKNLALLCLQYEFPYILM